MYNIKNEKDIPYILKYHRANDMVNIFRFFPGLSPIKDLVVITSKEDYLNNKDEITALTSIRNGNPITQHCMKSIPVKEKDADILEVIDKIKEENQDGVLILFNLETKATERYERYAGISVAVSLGNAIYIEAVGKGFDGREVLKGVCCHEKFYIPWDALNRVSISNFEDYRIYLVSQEKYEETRKERIEYLMSCGLDKTVLEENIPIEYTKIPDFIWLDIIKNIIKVVAKEEDFLRMCNYTEFNLSGHTEEKRFRPWQMVNDKRM